MISFVIYFTDLNKEAQQALMDAIGISDPREMNWDSPMVPLAIVDINTED